MHAQAPQNPTAFTSYAEKVEGNKIRQRSPSFGDHFSQATLFWNSMSSWEKKHIAEAFSFELNMLETPAIQEKVLNELLANVADELAQKVGLNIGMTPKRRAPEGITPEASAQAPKKREKKPLEASPALSMDKPGKGIKGRKIAILAADGVDGKQIAELKTQLAGEGAIVEVIARFAGMIAASNGKEIAVDRPAPNAPSVIYDAVVVPGGKGAEVLAQLGLAVHFVSEMFVHCKAIGAIDEGVELLEAAQIDPPEESGVTEMGVVTGSGANLKAFIAEFVKAVAMHRHFDREIESVPA
jgi:catalase